MAFVCEDDDSHVRAEPNIVERSGVSLPANVALSLSLMDGDSRK